MIHHSSIPKHIQSRNLNHNHHNDDHGCQGEVPEPEAPETPWEGGGGREVIMVVVMMMVVVVMTTLSG